MPYSEDYQKWLKWAYRQIYKEKVSVLHEAVHKNLGLTIYEPKARKYWDDERGLGVIEVNGKYIGVACLVAKAVVDKESFIRRFGLSFEKDVQWRAVSSLLDHLSRSPMFKAVLVTMSKVPFKLEPDIPEKLKGRIRWARRNYEFHKAKAEAIRREMELPSFGGVHPIWLPKQLKEEESHARYFLDTLKSLEQQVEERFKNYFAIKENLFAVALFFYVYTDAKSSVKDALREIEARRYSAKMEMFKTYFVECSDIKDPNIVFNPEFFLAPMR
jgi:hypothetical protein